MPAAASVRPPPVSVASVSLTAGAISVVSPPSAVSRGEAVVIEGSEEDEEEAENEEEEEEEEELPLAERMARRLGVTTGRGGGGGGGGGGAKLARPAPAPVLRELTNGGSAMSPQPRAAARRRLHSPASKGS